MILEFRSHLRAVAYHATLLHRTRQGRWYRFKYLIVKTRLPNIWTIFDVDWFGIEFRIIIICDAAINHGRGEKTKQNITKYACAKPATNAYRNKNMTIPSSEVVYRIFMVWLNTQTRPFWSLPMFIAIKFYTLTKSSTYTFAGTPTRVS